MKKSQGVRLKLNRETLRTLASPELGLAVGDGTGGGIKTINVSCGGTCAGASCVVSCGCPTVNGGSCSFTTSTC
jgi:hypothetical protein